MNTTQVSMNFIIPNPRKSKETNHQEIIYVLKAMRGSANENVLATLNVREISQTYVLQMTSTYPAIEVWKNGVIIGVYTEREKIVSRVKKAVTKIAMEL